MWIKVAFKSHYQDQGTDIYIKKKDQGAGYGSGYTVEIYEYGQKVDEIEAKTKKQIREIVNQQKSKYNTDRAFEVESHLFISYRIDDIESKKFRKDREIVLKGEEPKMDKIIKSSNIDVEDQLYRKAAKLEYLLRAARYPEVPQKVFRKADQLFDFNQPVTSNGSTSTTEEKLSVDEVVNQISEKLTAYFSVTQDDEATQYNKVKEKLPEYGNILKQEGYTDTEVVEIQTKLKEKYHNSELPGYQTLTKAASYFTKLKQSGAIGNNIIPGLGNSAMNNQNNMQSSTQATPTNIAVQQDSTLSMEARNLLDQLNTKENEIDIQQTIKDFPNSDKVVEEIVNSQDNTLAAETIKDYYATKQASILYDITQEEFIKFSNFASAQKGRNSFRSLYNFWIKQHNYSFSEKACLDFKLNSFINEVTNKTKKAYTYKDKYYNVAAEKVFAFMISRFASVKWSLTGNNIEQYAPNIKSFFEGVYNSVYTLDNKIPTADIESYGKTLLTHMLKHLKLEELTKQLVQVCATYIHEVFLLALNDPEFLTQLTGKEGSTSTEGLQILNSNKELFLQVIDISKGTQSIIGAYRQFLTIMDSQTKQDFDVNHNIKHTHQKAKDAISQLTSVFLSEGLKVLTQYGAVGYPGFENVLQSVISQLNREIQGKGELNPNVLQGQQNQSVQASLSFVNRRYAVNIIINESPDGSSSVQVDDQATIADTPALPDSTLATDTSSLDNTDIEDTPVETENSLLNDNISTDLSGGDTNIAGTSTDLPTTSEENNGEDNTTLLDMLSK